MWGVHSIVLSVRGAGVHSVVLSAVPGVQALVNAEAAEVELLCLKILLRLLCFGFNRIDLADDVPGLLSQTMQMLQSRFEQALQVCPPPKK